jgi:predicted nuclease of predicted toxin-antitoxin system
MLRADLADLLGAAGHDVVRASEVGQARADDSMILERAVVEKRTLITLDQHFGDWAVLPLSRHFGVIRVKVHPTSTKSIAAILLPFLAKQVQTSFSDRLIILSNSRVRWIQTANE